jgi:hypothetical protein
MRTGLIFQKNSYGIALKSVFSRKIYADWYVRIEVFAIGHSRPAGFFPPKHVQPKGCGNSGKECAERTPPQKKADKKHAAPTKLGGVKNVSLQEYSASLFRA